ncbi:MAG TPA: 4-(cytidine 5'-diphospho)-2-C-methyl-D-erythritol kinase [Candidatus Sumerlaeota bacterium]|nr:4-(cytidine 5'-diphospho)-2-C-methyl-D-erythritol kinase [Candidatus Sumerlaeota bacterium]
MLSLSAPAKINLYLRIAGRRPDGYHDIETLFQRVELADRIEAELTAGSGFGLECHGLPEGTHLPVEDNLMTRAWRALRGAVSDTPDKFPGVRMRLFKQIPLGGGLGGGSSDAAAALKALEALWGVKAAPGELRRVAAGLGADVPFFLESAPAAIGRGIGERLDAFRHPCRFWTVLALPDFGVPTAEVYRRYDPASPLPDQPLVPLLEALSRQDLTAVLAALWNGMEPLAFALRPELGALRATLERSAGQPVRMSGSGSTLFTLAETEPEAQEIVETWRPEVRCEVTRFA